MRWEIVALVMNTVISFIVPVIMAVVLIRKIQRKKMLFFAGILVYVVMQWGVKEHGMQYLFNHTHFMDFMNQHYLLYLFVVALAGAVLTVLGELFVVMFVCRKHVDFKQAVIMELGYTGTEAVMLVGYRSVYTIFEILTKEDAELGTTTGELFLSGYERILLALIQITLFAGMVYLIRQHKSFEGSIMKVVCHTFAAFLPGFIIAFSTKEFLELFDRPVALFMVYAFLTVAAIGSIFILNSLKEKLYE